MLLHHNIVTAVIVGVSWGAAPLGLGWALADLLVPGWVIRTSESLTAGTSDYRKAVREYFDKRFAIAGAEPWKDPIARKRLRILGAGLTVIWLAILAVLVWLPNHLDAFFLT